MPQVRASTPSPFDLDEVIDRFESAWQGGQPPSLDPFLAPGGKRLDPPDRRKLLAELVKIDLDYRWKRAAQEPLGRDAGDPLPRRPKLEDYVRRFPDLGPLEQLTPDLIAEEYCVRHCWGDRPGHPEYIGRFKAQAPRLPKVLAQIDSELVMEQPLSLLPAKTEQTPSAHLATVDDLLTMLREKPLLSPKQYDQLLVEHLRKPFADARTLARMLMERNWLTPYQANQIMTGQEQELVLGSYVLLERLGEGMRGKVYKAWHGRMKRMVALKLIKKELLAEPEAVSRFYQEIQAASQLSHPHVVHAYDAGPVDQTHFLAMEFVEGIDLARMVKQSGPLPPPLACEYARQVALGLQHAHEHGLVHRDIKPANLLLTRPPGPQAGGVGVVKILDMGLARVRKSAKDSGTLTQEGTVMGTPDYMSPEQALDPRQADIRTDVYSLGCTLYYLLTGQVPFPGGTLIQKVEAHRWQTPEPVEKVRPDVPRPVAEVVRKLMAKRPEDRYATPKDVAAVLQPLAGGAAPVARVVAGKQSNPPAAVPVRVARLLPSRLAPIARLILPEKSRRFFHVAAGLCCLVGGFTLVFFLMRNAGTKPRGGPGGITPITFRLPAATTWKDTFVDVRSGDVVTVKASGTWQRAEGAPACAPDGNATEPAEHNLVPAYPPMCLLARIGDVEPPFVLGSHKVINARKPGRLFLQANLRPADGGNGEITIQITGGQTSGRDAPGWVFGYGEFDAENKAVKTFTPLPYIVGQGWQGGPAIPDPNTGWVFFRGDAGHPGGPQQSAIRRWVVPHDAVITIAGTLSHAQADGDGVQGRVVITRLGEVGTWTAHNAAVETNVTQQEVKQGDVVDVVVDCRTEPSSDSFTWRPVFFMLDRTPPAATPAPE